MDQVELTPLEIKCLAEITEAWNTYLLLPELHPDDRLEMRIAIHVIQNIILARLALRQTARG